DDQRIAQYPSDIAGHTERQPIGGTPGSDPRIHIARSPIVGSEGIGPLAILSEHPGKISSPQQPILAKVEPVATANVNRRCEAHLHRSLRTVEFRAPHTGIGTMPRLNGLHGKDNAIE